MQLGMTATSPREKRGYWEPTPHSPPFLLWVTGILLKGACAHVWRTSFCGRCPKNTPLEPIALVANRGIWRCKQYQVKNQFLTSYLFRTQCRESRQKHLAPRHSLKEICLHTLVAAALGSGFQSASI